MKRVVFMLIQVRNKYEWGRFGNGLLEYKPSLKSNFHSTLIPLDFPKTLC